MFLDDVNCFLMRTKREGIERKRVEREGEGMGGEERSWGRRLEENKAMNK